jgi:hypothetical protein
MKRLHVLCALFLLAMSAHAEAASPPAAWSPASPPVAAQAPVPDQGMNESSDGQSVEEPDAPDEDVPPETKGAEVPGQTEDNAVKPVPEATPPKETHEGDASFDRVILQGLNKVTARAQTLEAPIGSVVRFGTIEIVAHKCWKSAPEERPENAALLEISEIKQGEAPQQIFLGWMFSSSPGLSALEHPFYDVTVVGCDKAEEPKPAADAKDSGAKPAKESVKKPSKEPAKEIRKKPRDN